MNDRIFSANNHLSNNTQDKLLTPQPTYPKINQFENFNNISNISTEHSLKEESKNFRGLNFIGNSENDKYSNENSDEIFPLLKPEPITIKRSSFKICKNFLLSKIFEEQKIQEISTFSNLRVKSKYSNFKEFPLNAKSCNVLKKSPEFDLDVDINSYSNNDFVLEKKNLNKNYFSNKKSSLFPLNKNQGNFYKNFECMCDNKFLNNSKAFNFSKNYQTENLNVNFNSNINNNIFDNDNNYHIDLNEDKLNFQNFERRIFPGQINNYNSNNLNYNTENWNFGYNICTNNKLEEIKLLNNKNSAISNSTCKIKKRLFKYYNKLNNKFNHRDHDLEDNEIYKTDSKSKNRFFNICGNSQVQFDSHIKTDFLNNNFSNNNIINSNKSNFQQHQGEKHYEFGKQKETLFNFNNFTNIYINMENNNHPYYSKTNLSENSVKQTMNKNITDCDYLESKKLLNLPIRNNTNFNDKHNKSYKYIFESPNKYVCSDRTYSELLLSEKPSNKKIFKKIFNICEVIICNNKVKKLSNGFFDIYNIELVEQIYKNNFKSLNLNQKDRNSKKLTIDNNDLDNYNNENITKNNEGIIIANIQIKIKELFSELLDIQKKYLTKASGYISKKQLLNCSKCISEINNLSDILAESQPALYFNKEEEDNELINVPPHDQQEISNKKCYDFFSNYEEEELELNITNQILNEKDKDKKFKIKEKNNLMLNKIKNKRNELIIDYFDKSTNLFINSNENKSYPLNLDLNGSNQYDFIKNKTDLEFVENSNIPNNSIHSYEKNLNNEIFKSNTNQESLIITNVRNNDNFHLNSIDKINFNANSNDLFKRENIISQNIVSYTTSHLNKNANIRTTFEDLKPEKSEALSFSMQDNLKIVYNSNIISSNTTENLKNDFKKKKINENLSEIKQINSINNVNKLIYKCNYCDAFYYTGQALGGHMSRTHPNLSVKYKMKKMVRDRRENQRNVLSQARRELLNKYNLDYEDMKYDKIKKHILKGFIKSHGLEYKELVKKLKKMRKLK